MTARAAKGRFRRRDALHGWTLHFGPNMTPMVDVVMVILVFFMASAAFVGADWYLRAGVVAGGKGAQGSSATSQSPRDPLAQRVEVVMDTGTDGRTLVTALDLTRAPIEAFAAKMAAMPRGPATSKLEMIVRPAVGVPYQDVVRVHESCYGAGIEKVGLGLR